MPELVLTKHFNDPATLSVTGYVAQGGYSALKKALTLTREQVVEEVKKSSLRGRGGAGFPCGVKWGFLPKDKTLPRYLCVNADEGEPGTFKDRALLLKAPHLLLEGIGIACYALEIKECWIYFRGEFEEERLIMQKALSEAKSFLFDANHIQVRLYSGAGAYICGEETALLDSLEGKKGFPRIKPPFPAVKGLYQSPTIINNVETLCCLPAIISKGADWFCGLGLPKDGGTKLYCLSGQVNKPGLYELPMGTSLRELIYTHGQGIKNNGKLKAVLPGGSSSSFLAENEIGVNMDFDSMAKAGTMLGSAAIMVYDQKTCMLEVMKTITHFYAHESCGQCTPCREGTGWMDRIVDQLVDGKGQVADLDLLVNICDNMVGKTICVFSEAVAMPVKSLIVKFRKEMEEHIKNGGCTSH